MTPYYEQDGITIYHADCRDVLPLLDPVDLVMTDPPYGIGESREKNINRGTDRAPGRDYGHFDWDQETVASDLIYQCRDVGKWACIFGGNYYAMPPSSCWLIWDKEINGDFADAELAWTNYPCAVRLLRHMWNGMLRVGREARFHPTQKPLAVIKWAISLAPASETVLDPFMGSGTTLRACKDLGKRCIGIEREERYCEIAVNRLAQGVLAFA